MPNKPSKRRTKSVPVPEALATLYRVKPYHRNEISPSQIARLQDLIDLVGFPAAAAEIGVHKQTLLTVCAGFGHKLSPVTVDVIREHLRNG